MTTVLGRALVKARLTDCQNLDALRRLWEGLGVDYKACEEVKAHKDALKAQFEKE